MLGWALSNALDESSLVGKETYYDVQPQNSALMLIAPGFSALTVLAYAAIFLALKKIRLYRLRYLSPWLAALLAAVVGFSVVAAFELSLLLSHHIEP